jgi:hypothetical protein
MGKFFATGALMYHIVLALHNLVRWAVIGAGLWAVIRFWRGWMGRAIWTHRDATAAKVWVAALDVQFVLGILLYAILSPLTHRAFGDLGAAMRDPATRYFVVDHEAIMIVAIAIAHVASVRVKRATTDSARFQTAAIWFGVALAAIIGFVPWMRPALPTF